MLYPRLDLYVEDFLAVIYERPLPNGRRTWCPQWWKHDEAVYRLQALWLSWEAWDRHHQSPAVDPAGEPRSR